MKLGNNSNSSANPCLINEDGNNGPRRPTIGEICRKVSDEQRLPRNGESTWSLTDLFCCEEEESAFQQDLWLSLKRCVEMGVLECLGVISMLIILCINACSYPSHRSPIALIILTSPFILAIIGQLAALIYGLCRRTAAPFKLAIYIQFVVLFLGSVICTILTLILLHVTPVLLPKWIVNLFTTTTGENEGFDRKALTSAESPPHLKLTIILLHFHTLSLTLVVLLGMIWPVSRCRTLLQGYVDDPEYFIFRYNAEHRLRRRDNKQNKKNSKAAATPNHRRGGHRNDADWKGDAWVIGSVWKRENQLRFLHPLSPPTPVQPFPIMCPSLSSPFESAQSAAQRNTGKQNLNKSVGSSNVVDESASLHHTLCSYYHRFYYKSPAQNGEFGDVFSPEPDYLDKISIGGHPQRHHPHPTTNDADGGSMGEGAENGRFGCGGGSDNDVSRGTGKELSIRRLTNHINANKKKTTGVNLCRQKSRTVNRRHRSSFRSSQSPLSLLYSTSATSFTGGSGRPRHFYPLKPLSNAPAAAADDVNAAAKKEAAAEEERRMLHFHDDEDDGSLYGN